MIQPRVEAKALPEPEPRGNGIPPIHQALEGRHQTSPAIVLFPRQSFIKKRGEKMAQSFVQNLQHIVFSTKNRDKWIDESWEKDLHAYIGGILRGINCSMKAAGGGADHIHILASINKKLTLPDVIRTVKASSTNWIKKNIRNKRAFSWQHGYASFSIGQSQIKQVENYIRNQRKHHRRFGYQDELRSLLDKQGFEYDEKYLWL